MLRLGRPGESGELLNPVHSKMCGRGFDSIHASPNLQRRKNIRNYDQNARKNSHTAEIYHKHQITNGNNLVSPKQLDRSEQDGHTVGHHGHRLTRKRGGLGREDDVVGAGQ